MKKAFVCVDVLHSRDAFLHLYLVVSSCDDTLGYMWKSVNVGKWYRCGI